MFIFWMCGTEGNLVCSVHSSSFSYLAQGRMPKSKELLFLCRNVGTEQHSALLCCLCFTPHLSPSSYFSIFFPASLCFLPHFQCTLNSSPMLFFLPLHSCYRHSFFLSLLVDLCNFFLLFPHTFPILYPYCVFASPFCLLSPLNWHFPCFSVPASRSSPLSAAEAAQGQLLSGGDEAG